MKKAIIIAAGEFTSQLLPQLSPQLLSQVEGQIDGQSPLLIAADGGYNHCRRLGITPDLLVGDFDSIGDCGVPVNSGNIEVMRHPPEKDASDLELAVDEALRRGCRHIRIYGALGGRLDHTIASIAVLVSLSRKGATGWLVGKNESITAVTDGTLRLNQSQAQSQAQDCADYCATAQRGYVSIFPAGEKAAGVSLRGLKYTLDNAELTCHSTLGLSNEWSGGEAEIAVKDGTLIVVISNA